MARILAFSVVLATTIALAIVECRSVVEVASADKLYVPRCWNNTMSGISCGNIMTDDRDRLYPHPKDCGIFYVCLGPELPPICLECPGELVFDAKNSICDYPENVSCSVSTQ